MGVGVLSTTAFERTALLMHTVCVNAGMGGVGAVVRAGVVVATAAGVCGCKKPDALGADDSVNAGFGRHEHLPVTVIWWALTR